MKKIIFSFSVYLLLTYSVVAQELTQVKPDCSPKIHGSSDLSPSSQPVIYEATINLLPTILTMVKPMYTAEASEAGVYGTILAAIVFQADGKITKVNILRGLPSGLNDQVILAAKQIQFLPAVKDGVPVSVRAKLEFSFALSDLDSKQITNILEKEYGFLSPQTTQKLAENYAKSKLALASIKKQPIRDEELGINQLPPDDKNELLQLREAGLANLCVEQQQLYTERMKQLSQLPDIELTDSIQIVLSGYLFQLSHLRELGIRTLPIKNQKRFVELYNRAILLGHNSQQK